MEFGRVGVGFEEGNMEDGVKTGKVWGETELVGVVGDGAFNGEWTEAAMIELVGRTSRLDMATEQPHELVRLVLRRVGDALVVVPGLTFLCVLQLCAKLVVKTC